MARVSDFSTPENYTKLQEALAKAEHARREAQIAVSAGLPDAGPLLKQAEDAIKSIKKVLMVYFPTGEPEPEQG